MISLREPHTLHSRFGVTPVTEVHSLDRYPSEMDHIYSRRNFLQTSLIGSAAFAPVPHFLRAFGARKPALSLSNGGEVPSVVQKPAFPVADYHVHLSPTLSIDQALQLGKERGVQIGIVEHPGPGYPINTDLDLKKYIDGLGSYPVRIGLQPVYPGWSKAFSKALLDELDYVLMDALTLPRPEGAGCRSGRSTPWSTTKRHS